MAYLTKWESYQTQVDLLKQRGMTITDEAKALEYLERIGYCRLEGYWYPFRNDDLSQPKAKKAKLDTFKSGTCFKHAVDLYIFDKKLRLLLMDALERIEIAVREDVAYLLGEKDIQAHLNPNYFQKSFNHSDWTKKYNKLEQRSYEDCIKSYRKHGQTIPIWLACEVWDFGTLSWLFKGMLENDQDKISTKYGVANGSIFASWLDSLNYMRNVCTHHSRLWDRNIDRQPKFNKKLAVGEVRLIEPFRNDYKRQTRVYLLICITRHLLDKICPSSEWWKRLKEHMQSEFPDIEHLEVRLSDMGTITDWYK